MTYNEIYDLLTALADKRSARYSGNTRESFKIGYLKAYLVEIIKNDPKLIADLQYVMTLDI